MQRLTLGIRSSVGFRDSSAQNHFGPGLLSETTLPIKAKFQASSSELGTKVCINAQGHMTKMDTAPIYGKKL